MRAAKLLFLALLPILPVLSLSETADAACPGNVVRMDLPDVTLSSVGKDRTSVSGSVNKRISGRVQICIDGALGGTSSPVTPDGKFTATVPALKAGQKVVAQFVSTDAATAGELGPPSGEDVSDSNFLSKIVLIGGLEQSSYSSLGQNTNPFINAFLEGPDRTVTGWGRIRLLSAPQPSTQGIVSTFTDPTGQLQKLDYSKVGEALDFVMGPRLKIHGSDHWALIAEFGVTTPLSSQTVALSYVVPGPNTVECKTLASRFTVQNGYSPGLTLAPPGSTTCLSGGYTDVAFSNQDRSSFLLKYGAGFRTSNKFECTDCPDSDGVLDLTVGQDEAVTRGLLRHWVFKMDGMLPIQMGKGNPSYLYLFGSAYIRLAKNQDLSPLILQTASGVTIPSPSVIVLPLQQPDRDFYRLGVGLNLSQIFCKMFNSCSK